MTPKRYLRGPDEVEAMLLTDETFLTVVEWSEGNITPCYRLDKSGMSKWLEMGPFGDSLRAEKGEYVVRTAKGEFYPCRADIFHQTYKEVQP